MGEYTFFWYLQVWLEVAMGWNWAVIGAVKVAIKECLKRWTARGHCARALWAGANGCKNYIFFIKFNSLCLIFEISNHLTVKQN